MSKAEDITSWSECLEASIQGTFISRVMVFEETLSTQDAAARACIGQPKDHQATLIVASRQLMGRGQRANNWYDAPSQTLPCSIAFGPELLGFNNPNLAARVGLATLDAVGHSAPDSIIKIKWPNDIVTTLGGVGGSQKKIAGILIEHARDSIVVGIGINCSQADSDFHPSIKDSAVSLKQLGSKISRVDLCCKLLESLNHWLTIATEEDVQQHWQQHDALVGTQAKLVHNNQPHTGTILSIDPLNNICLQTSTSEIKLPVEQTRLIS